MFVRSGGSGGNYPEHLYISACRNILQSSAKLRTLIQIRQ